MRCGARSLWWMILRRSSWRQGKQRSIMNNLRGKTIFITGASRGIGREIALRCARDGVHVVITGKTATAHPKLPGAC